MEFKVPFANCAVTDSSQEFRTSTFEIDYENKVIHHIPRFSFCDRKSSILVMLNFSTFPEPKFLSETIVPSFSTDSCPVEVCCIHAL